MGTEWGTVTEHCKMLPLFPKGGGSDSKPSAEAVVSWLVDHPDIDFPDLSDSDSELSSEFVPDSDNDDDIIFQLDGNCTIDNSSDTVPDISVDNSKPACPPDSCHPPNLSLDSPESYLLFVPYPYTL